MRTTRYRHTRVCRQRVVRIGGLPKPPRLMDYIYYHYISIRLISIGVREPEPLHYPSARGPNRRSRGPPLAQFKIRHRANSIYQLKIVAATSARDGTTILIKLEESVALGVFRLYFTNLGYFHGR